MKVLIVYYSTFGNVYKMAKLVAEGIKQIEGVEAVIRRVKSKQVNMDGAVEMG